MQQSLYYQSTSETTPSIDDLANWKADIWKRAHLAALKDGFWDKIASNLQDHIMFVKEKSEITSDKLRNEFYTVLARLEKEFLSADTVSNRFSSEQRFIIVCIEYDINTIDMHFSADL